MQRYAIIARLFAGLTLTVCWGLVDSPLSGVVLILVLTALSIVRYRFVPYRYLGIIEAVVCACYAIFWLPSLLGLWLPLIGVLEDRWSAWEQELLYKDFEDRGKRLKLEDERKDSALEIQNAARLAELSERSRIAQEIHDHVGHEISGASIALQTAIRLYQKGDERAGELFMQSAARVEAAAEHLREAVHNLKPTRIAGIDSLEDLCERFSFCDIDFQASGDLSGAAHWELLAANLKETLTNVSRHSSASKVMVRVDGNADYIRMTVSDNGILLQIPKQGLGLTGMRERVRAAGGTMTVSADNGFVLVTVLPKGGDV